MIYLHCPFLGSHIGKLRYPGGWSRGDRTALYLGHIWELELRTLISLSAVLPERLSACYLDSYVCTMYIGVIGPSLEMEQRTLVSWRVVLDRLSD